jgi:hypothetical protein
VNITPLVQWITVPFVEIWYLTRCVLNASDIYGLEFHFCCHYLINLPFPV